MPRKAKSAIDQLKITTVPLAELRLDPLNPRLPEELRGQTQAKLLKHIASAYEPLEVGRSIARYGYFASEPVIVMPERAHYVVLEGNRRLSAMQLLSNPKLADGLPDKKDWVELSKTARLTANIPAVVIGNRAAVAPVIGYRHISGIQPWDPFAKARFIVDFVEGQKLSFEEVAAIVGSPESEVRSKYRDYSVLRQAKAGRVDTKRAEESFTVFQNAMRTREVQKFLGAASTKDVKPERQPLPASKRGEVKELLGLMFGDEKHPESALGDSRNMTRFVKVLGSKDGLAALRKTRSLEIAENTAANRRTRVIRHLERAHSYLNQAAIDVAKVRSDPQVAALLQQCSDRLREMMGRGPR